MQVLPSELVRCNPDRGRVPSGGTLDMELTLSCMEPQSVNTQVCSCHMHTFLIAAHLLSSLQLQRLVMLGLAVFCLVSALAACCGDDSQMWVLQYWMSTDHLHWAFWHAIIQSLMG